MTVPATFFASSFRNPLGGGLTSPENEGDGFYVAFGFNEPKPDIGGSRHLGTDWNGEGGGNTDLGDPVYAIGNGTVVAIVSDQGRATTGFGNYIVLRHDLPEPTLINGQWVAQVQSLYAHLDTTSSFSVGQQVGIGTQIGTLGMSGYADVAHLHLEITIGSVLPTDDDGYNPSGAPSGWVDPVSLVVERTERSTSPFGQLDALTLGSFLSRAVYGGSAIAGEFQGTWRGDSDPQNYDDNYRGYLSSQSYNNYSWQLLAASELGASFFSGPNGGNFTSGGLYRSSGGAIEENFGEAAVALTSTISGETVLVLSFRGSDGGDAFTQGQTFTALGLANYYLRMRPIIEAAAAYAQQNDINNIVVSGHSLGGTITDLFALADADLFSGRNLHIVSLASAGLDPTIAVYRDVLGLDLFNCDVSYYPGLLINAALNSVGLPDYVSSYTGIAHSEDRVSFDVERGVLNNLTPNIALELNRHFSFDTTIDLPNLTNSEVIYPGRAGYEFDHGFGAEHNAELYWTHIQALVTDPLYQFRTSHVITMGLTDYSKVADVSGSLLPLFQDYTGLSSGRYYDDLGTKQLVGSNASDYILGLAGNDRIVGFSGSDLLSGGAGDDILEGREGADRLAGGSGTDRLIGGFQADVFFFSDDDFPLFQSMVPDRITDYNRGTGTFSATEGDLIDLSGFSFAGGSVSSSTVRLVSVAASGGLPAGAFLEVLVGDPAAGIWQGIARLDGVAAGEAVRIALTEAQSAARTGSTFVVDAVGNGATWSISPATRNVAEGNVTISFTITRSGTNLGSETVYVSTTQTQGFYNDSDYVGRLNVPVVFAAGDTSQTFTVRINADAVPEGDETFGVIVQADSNDPVSVRHAIASFTIQNGAPPTVGGANYLGDELDNVWSGTSANDLAIGMAGNDRLTGAGGNDILSGGEGSDSIYGGAGNDIVVTGSGSNNVDGGSGNDVIDAQSPNYAAGTILGGLGDDIIFVGSEVGIGGGPPPNGLWIANVDGGGGTDRLVVETGVTRYPVQGLEHRFGDGLMLNFGSSQAEILAAISRGGAHQMLTGNYSWWNGASASWIYAQGIERYEYRGRAGNDLFVSWGDNLAAAYGGDGTDALYADWSTTTAAIVWNLTVNNDTQRTLGNGVVVQSIERLMLRTGSGNDNLILQAQDNYVDAGSGNDYIGARSTAYARGTIIGGLGNDIIHAGSGADRPPNGLWVLNIDGGGGTDRLIVETGSVQYPNQGLTHQFGDGPTLTYGSTYAEIVTAAGSESIHRMLTDNYSWWNGASAAWMYAQNIELYEYRGKAGNDLFVSWGDNLAAAYGGDGTDALYADWSTTTAAIVWNLTVNNDTQRTLGNGVVVQSIERLMVRTGSGNDNLVMGDGEDYVETGAGNDTLNGGGGIDTLIGGIGNDTYIVDGTEQITEAANGGTDTIQTAMTWSLARNLENLTLTGTDNINGTGNSAANIIRGNGGNNRLNGGTGNDTLIGGTGNDTYLTDGGDRITEGVDGGTDLVQSSATHTLGANIENLTLAGTAAINGTGNVLNNVLRGNAASNVLSGSTGSDTLIGGAGNDTYVTDGGDRITEGADAGIDLMQSSVNYTLGSNLENLTLTGVGAINGTGNSLNNVIRGNAAANTLNGGLGNDAMVGGAGMDTFVFNSALGVGNVDRISDFNVADDAIRLDDAVFVGLARGTLSATAFAANAAGQAAATTDRIIYETDTGRLYYDADGLGGTGRVQFGAMTERLALANVDFFVF